jgi:DNA-binding NarL/FixJ family response regulator
VIELRRGDIAAAAQHIACRPATGPQFADIYARPETIAAEAQITEARDGPAAALGQLRQLGAELEARPGLLLGDPALAAWLARTALATGDSELAASAARAAQALADAHPGFPALAAAAAHSQGLAHRDPASLAEAATQHPDPWARASAAEDLGVLHGRQGDREQAICHMKEALGGYRQVGADRDQARIRRRLRMLGIRRRHWTTPSARPVTGWDSLTETEQAVAALVAQGLNNNQVAARMYISTHTVAHHLRQAFRKLSIASRVELTRVVIEHAADGARPGELATLTMRAAGSATILSLPRDSVPGPVPCRRAVGRARVVGLARPLVRPAFNTGVAVHDDRPRPVQSQPSRHEPHRAWVAGDGC